MNPAKRKLSAFFLLGSSLLFFAHSGCARREGVTVVLGAYTTPREAYRKIIPLFQKYWKEKTGETVRFKESYLGSGAQSRAIVGGFEADLAALSLEADIARIEKAGLIRQDWRARPHGGIVSHSLVVLAVRRDNPKNIRDWADLARLNLSILTPNPKASGGAMWNIAAAYGAAKRGRVAGYQAGDEGARRFLRDVMKNVSVFDKGARESIISFEKGIGDVLISYENEVLMGRKASGDTYEMKIPASTILIENPVAVIDQYAEKHGVKEAAEAFRDFLWTREAQRVFAEFGFRPVDAELEREAASKFPPPRDLWTIDYLGGWDRVIREFFGLQGIFTQVMEEVEKGK